DHENEEHGRDEAEGVRVAYVAATRARDLLAVAAVGDGERDGWLKPPKQTLYPKRASLRSSLPASLCPEFGVATVLESPGEFDGLDEGSVRPGLHTPEFGDHEVVWWDPAILRLDVEPSLGLRQEDILRDDPAERAQASIAQYQEWKTAREQAVSTGA